MLSPTVRAFRWAAPGVAALVIGAAVGAARARPAAPRAHATAEVGGAVLAAARAIPTEVPEPEPDARCPEEPVVAVRALEPFTPLELARRIREDPKSLGSASIGTPISGRLWGAVQLLASDDIVTAGDQPWGTEIAVRSIERAVREVRRCLPGGPKLSVGDISRKEGGWLRPHRSHQSGLDADIGYYYSTGPAWFQHADASNLDRARTWALVRALIDGGTVESIFMDRSIQKLLREHAQEIEADRGRLDDIFESEKRRHDVVIHHAHGHATHFHVRFKDPPSVALGLRIEPMIRGKITPAPASRAPIAGAASRQGAGPRHGI